MAEFRCCDGMLLNKCLKKSASRFLLQVNGAPALLVFPFMNPLLPVATVCEFLEVSAEAIKQNATLTGKVWVNLFCVF